MTVRSFIRTTFFSALLLVAAGTVCAQTLVGILGIAREIAPIEQRFENSHEVTVHGYVFRAGTLEGPPVVRQTTDGLLRLEMEGAAVMQTCRQFNVACLVVRGVTDRADGQAEASYDQYIVVASANAAALVADIVQTLAK